MDGGMGFFGHVDVDVGRVFENQTFFASKSTQKEWDLLTT